MKITIKGIAIIRNPTMTAFMQAADLFERFKVVGDIINLHYEYEEDGEANGDVAIVVGQTAMKNQFKDKLIFGYIQTAEYKSGDVVVKHTNKILAPVFDNNISVVSTGKKWCLLVDVLKKFPELEYEEGEVRKIKTLTFKK